MSDSKHLALYPCWMRKEEEEEVICLYFCLNIWLWGVSKAWNLKFEAGDLPIPEQFALLDDDTKSLVFSY